MLEHFSNKGKYDMAFSVIQLPQLRTAYPLDLSAINSALDDVKEDREKNRLLAERKAIGADLLPQTTSTNGASPYQVPQNAMLAQPATPAQASFAASGRDYAPAASSNAAEFIKREEGYAPTAKWDVRQNSGGYGSRSAPGETFTPQKAEQYLRRDIAPVEGWLNANAPNLSQEQRTALTSFGYNLGVDDLERLKPDIQAGNWQRVAERMKTFNKAQNASGQLEVLPGLTARRGREAALVYGGSPATPAQTGAPAAPSSSGVNYRAAAATAFRQGNVELGISLLKQQQVESDTSYERSRQATQDAMTAETHGLTTEQARNALHDRASKLIGTIANTIASEPDAGKRSAMWQRFVSAHPDIAPDLREMGVDPADGDAGAKFLIARARGMEVGETFGTPVYTKGADGKPKLNVITKQGTLRPIQTQDDVLAPVKTVDQADQTAIIGPGGIQVQPAIPKNLVQAERDKKVGTGQGEAIVDLPRAQSNGNAILAQLDSLANDPYLKSMTGPVQGRLSNVSGDAQRVQSKVDQVNGQTFLQAFASLKGGGQITEIEGTKATAALSRLQNMKVNDADYPAALADFRNEVVRLMQLAEAKAANGGGAPAAAPAPSGNPPVQGARQAPDGHWYVQQNGQYFRVDQ